MTWRDRLRPGPFAFVPESRGSQLKNSQKMYGDRVQHDVGRASFARAVRMSGVVTWLVWVFIHIMSLPQLQNRLRVQTQWLWSYLTGQRGSRLISETPRGGA
jgi:NADH dehydrogenase FAD-containing subunit